MNPDERPSKRGAFLSFLREGWVSLHLDARHLGVEVPPALSDQPHLVLQYGRNMPIPIPDLEVTEGGVSATLSFSRASHQTWVPWEAVYVIACTDGRGVLYHEDVPADVTLGPDVQTDRAVSGDIDWPYGYGDDQPPRRALRSVPAPIPAEKARAAAVAASVSFPKRRRRPQLRLVK